VRVRKLNDAAIRTPAGYVLYWAQMNRRVESNHALAHAAQLANELHLPLLFYEGLTCTYPYANDRLHTFLLDGVPETERRAAALGMGYLFYLRRRRSDPDDVLYRLAGEAAAVVTDDYPTFIAAGHNARVPERIGVAFFAVDSSCIVPMNCFEKREWAAYSIRPKIRKLLPEYLRPVSRIALKVKWKCPPPRFHTTVREGNIGGLVAKSEIDHTVLPSRSARGGRSAAEKRLRHFLRYGLRRYAGEKNQPHAHVTSGISPYLHFGHLSSLEVALAVRDYASRHKIIAEEFLEELIVRRELAFNFARFTAGRATLEDLPDWARRNLKKHARDRRGFVYTRDQFVHAQTHDALWNATQKQMLIEGFIHGYYRMYWGKKIIEWSATYEEALETMVQIHDRYALDGRDPNTYANILWCFGLHDRPWPERPVFGTMRYMSLDGMKRKTNVAAYIQEIEQLETTA
jgi:deoxyribodipyrimidine photo-lyase